MADATGPTAEDAGDPNVDGSPSDLDAGEAVDDPLAAVPDDVAVVVFDGVCNLCTGTVQFVIPRDPGGAFRFAPLQSDVGGALYELCGEDTDRPQTFVLIEDGECHRKSSAAIRIGERLGGLYRVATLGRLVPKPLRDWVYDRVANNRYSIFGKRDSCMMPTPDIESRFLAMSPVGDEAAAE